MCTCSRPCEIEKTRTTKTKTSRFTGHDPTRRSGKGICYNTFFFFTLLHSSFWTSRGHRCRPFSPPVLASKFYRAQGSGVPLLVDLSSSIANPSSRAICKSICAQEKVPMYTSRHSGALELTKLAYTWLEDNLIRHRGDRLNTSRVESGRIRRCSKIHVPGQESGRVRPTRNRHDPQEAALKTPEKKPSCRTKGHQTDSCTATAAKETARGETEKKSSTSSHKLARFFAEARVRQWNWPKL